MTDTNTIDLQETNLKNGIGTFALLPEGEETLYGIIDEIDDYLTVKDAKSFIETSLLKQIVRIHMPKNKDTVMPDKHREMWNGVKDMFLCFTRFKAPYLSNKDMIQFSPFIGCINNEKPLEIMQLIIKIFELNFQKACHNCVYLGFNVDTNDIVNQIGRNSIGCNGSALMNAIEHDKLDIVKYLIQKGATISIGNTTNCDGTKHGNALHVAIISKMICPNLVNGVEIMKVLLNNMSPNDINQIIQTDHKLYSGSTPVDLAYRFELPDLVELLRQYGGQGNCYDTNGNLVGEGNGDLNGEQRSKIIVEDDIDIIKDLLLHMPLYEINRMNPADETLLDAIYKYSKSYHNTAIQQQKILFIRQIGGVAIFFDTQGNFDNIKYMRLLSKRAEENYNDTSHYRLTLGWSKWLSWLVKQQRQQQQQRWYRQMKENLQQQLQQQQFDRLPLQLDPLELLRHQHRVHCIEEIARKQELRHQQREILEQQLVQLRQQIVNKKLETVAQSTLYRIARYQLHFRSTVTHVQRMQFDTSYIVYNSFNTMWN